MQCRGLGARGYVLITSISILFYYGVEHLCADIEAPEALASIHDSDIELRKVDGGRFMLSSLEQYLRIYRRSSFDGYRVNIR